MKKILITLFAVLAISLISFGKQISPFEIGNTALSKEFEDGYSNWLFVQSDKALQFRLKQVKTESDIGYFQVQLRINFEDKIFCNHPTCLGYLLVFGYPTLDNEKNVETSYKFYNTFKGIYTLPNQVPIKLNFSDGSKRMLRADGFFYTLPGGGEELPTKLFGNCVDDILSNNPNYHRCKPYSPEFKESEATIIK